jgi:hypothetical protein
MCAESHNVQLCSAFRGVPGVELLRHFRVTAQDSRKAESMNEILEEIKSERQLEDREWSGTERDDVYEPEKWCSLLRHQIRLADRAACSMATDEITGAEEQSLVVGYRERLIKIAALAIAATESLDRIVDKRRESADKEGDLAKRSEGRANRRSKR